VDSRSHEELALELAKGVTHSAGTHRATSTRVQASAAPCSVARAVARPFVHAVANTSRTRPHVPRWWARCSIDNTEPVALPRLPSFACNACTRNRMKSVARETSQLSVSRGYSQWRIHAVSLSIEPVD
jgi:hypothetical protein